jgi:hypothetical protein
MACRGSFKALRADEAASFLAMADVDDRLEFLHDLYTQLDAENRWLSVDKAWDAMHRCLCDGWLDAEHGEEARRACVLGAKQLSDRPDWIISYVEPELVQRVSASIKEISREWFLEQYFALDKNPLDPDAHRYMLEWVDTEIDSEYTWDYFVEVRQFYFRVAEQCLAVVFTADQ